LAITCAARADALGLYFGANFVGLASCPTFLAGALPSTGFWTSCFETTLAFFMFLGDNFYITAEVLALAPDNTFSALTALLEAIVGEA